MSHRSRLPVAAFVAALALGACSKPAPQSALDTADERAKLGDEILVDPALAHGAKQVSRETPPPAPAPPTETARTAPQRPAPAAATAKAAPLPKASLPPTRPVRLATAAAPAAPVKPPSPAPAVTRTPVLASTAKPAPAKATRSAGNCLAKLQPGAAWATKLPAAFPLYPGAKLTDAAGIDHAGCNARAVSFTVSAPAAKMIDWYHVRATKAGFDAGVERSGADEILAGTGIGDSAYIITFGKRSGGVTTVDLIVNGAR